MFVCRIARRWSAPATPKARSRSSPGATGSTRSPTCGSVHWSAVPDSSSSTRSSAAPSPATTSRRSRRGSKRRCTPAAPTAFPSSTSASSATTASTTASIRPTWRSRTPRRRGFKEALGRAGAVVLEPISLLKVTIPSSYQGDVLADLTTRRGRVVGTSAGEHGEQEVSALGPDSRDHPLCARPAFADCRSGALRRNARSRRDPPQQPRQQGEGGRAPNNGGASSGTGRRAS